MHKQPAKPSYFFHGGFVDLKKVISGAFKRCGEEISKSSESVKYEFSEAIASNFIVSIINFNFRMLLHGLKSLFMFSFFLIRLISSAIITPLICFSITAFQIVILIILFLIVLLFFIMITLLDRSFCAIKAISNHCPVCQNRFNMPLYICPNCGIEHDRLHPGYYGVLKRICNCGIKLPTTFFNGRQKLEAQCPLPDCKCNIKDGGLHASWCIPVIGGPSSGKTCYINMLMMSLEKASLSMYGLQFDYERNGLDEYEENSQRLSKGFLPEKTTDQRLRYYQFTLTPRGDTKQQISLCDVAGELFDVTSSNAINSQIGFRFANSFILLIDPLAIPGYRSEISKMTNVNEYRGSVQPIDEMLDTFVRTLQNIFSVDAKAMLNTDVAVVFAKADLPSFDKIIGESAILKKAPGLTRNVKYETQNKLCEQFLREYNEDSFLNSLKSRFKSVQFFTCSALGHIMNGQPFFASNVEEPFFYLLSKRSKVIDRAIRQVIK